MSPNTQSSVPNMLPNKEKTQGMTTAVTKDSEVKKVGGTNHEDIISVRRNEGKFNVNAGGGADQVTLYGHDEITPTEFPSTMK